MARALEALLAPDLDEHAALRAHHWEGAGDDFTAASWHARAALAGVTLMIDASEHLRRMRTLADRLPPSPEADALRLRARVIFLIAGLRFGPSPDEVTTVFREGEELAHAAGDDGARARLLSTYAMHRAQTGLSDSIVHDFAEAVALSDRVGDRALRLMTRRNLLWGLSGHRHAAALLTVWEEAIASVGDLDRAGVDEIGYPFGFQFDYWRVLLLVNLGRLRESGAALEAFLAAADAHRMAGVSSLSRSAAAFHWNSVGDGERAHGHARLAVEWAERGVNVPLLLSSYMALGRATVQVGDLDGAERALERVLALAGGGTPRDTVRAAALAELAVVYVLRSNLGRAGAIAAEALAVALRTGHLNSEMLAQRALAEALLAHEGAGARARIEQALTRADEILDISGVVVRKPQIVETRAALARALGDEAGRLQHLRTAHRLYVEMDASGHAERLAKEIGSEVA